MAASNQLLNLWVSSASTAASNQLLNFSVSSASTATSNQLLKLSASSASTYSFRRTSFLQDRLTSESVVVTRLHKNSPSKLQGSQISALLLPAAANEDFKFGRTTSTGSVKIDVERLLQYRVGKPLRGPAQKPIEILPEQEALQIQELLPVIKENLSCIKDTLGEVSACAYDTAWVARIACAEDAGRPQFPGTLEWIVRHQHFDGSWGDELNYMLYDRFIQTLACIVALKSWNDDSMCVKRGVEYFWQNAEKLAGEEINRMPIGFELLFTELLEEAKILGLDLPYETKFFGTLRKMREEKLRRIPLKILHSYPTTLLHSLEGMQSLPIDWSKLLEFQSDDGSMLSSPAATAVVYMKTGNSKCLSFLEHVVEKFHNGIPVCYPLDTFQNLWVVDTLERLGISRYFKEEIEEVLSSVYRHWSDSRGICWASVFKGVPDLDDTSMAFRILRQHGYSVSSDAFKEYRAKDGGFQCFAIGQTLQGVSDMFNLHRATQFAHPGEEILEEAKTFTRDFLVDALRNNKGDADKWALRTDLSGEVKDVLKYPEHKSFKRMEVRHYLDKYGPEDAWIGKGIYR